ncbi:hypothetical protein QUF80_00245 [Desulfococcaceae bacterium HSG8]|nr:hypothetical protein [Desulfococcaceae bacterium HSG8]
MVRGICQSPASNGACCSVRLRREPVERLANPNHVQVRGICQSPASNIGPTHHALRITHHVSRITHHASRITHHASRITHHIM